MASVAFEHVSKRFPDGTSAVVDCTLQIADGELMVFVGPSGCGKSTLLRMLAGLETVTSGTVRIGDQVVNDLPPQQRNVAMVFQDYALYPHMSVRRNLEFPLRMRGLERAEIQRRVDWAAEILAIAPLLDRQPKQLSGGQRQRVAMGRALVREPTVFLLDEPLSNLDAKLRVQVRAEIGELQQRTGTTMIYVTHDQVEAMTLGHRVTVLDKGRLQQVAPPGELYAHPANVFVAGFIGNPPMNLFPTRVTVDASGHLQLTVGAQRVPIDLAHLPAVRQHLDQPLTGGVRPEGLTRATNETGTIAATVSHVEYLGHERLVYMRVADAAQPDGGVPLTARLPGMEPLEKGAPIALHVDAAQVYLFAADGGSLGVAPSVTDT